MWWKIINIALYQTIWFSCVLGGNLGSIAGLGLIGLHLALSLRRREDLRMIVILLSVGCLLDGSLQLLGILGFATPGLPIPFWLAVIWMGLALLVNHSLDWMKGKYLLCAVLSAVGGPLAYAGGAALGKADFPRGDVLGLVVLGFVWAGLWPWLMHLADRRRIKNAPHSGHCKQRRMSKWDEDTSQQANIDREKFLHAEQ